MLERRFYFQFDDMKKNCENFQQNNKFNWIYIIKKKISKTFPNILSQSDKICPKKPIA